jgi:hypothetical protein
VLSCCPTPDESERDSGLAELKFTLLCCPKLWPLIVVALPYMFPHCLVGCSSWCRCAGGPVGGRQVVVKPGVDLPRRKHCGAD